MACNAGCSTNQTYSYDPATLQLWASSNDCLFGMETNTPCSSTVNFNGDDLSGCGICSICGGGTPYFTTNGSGVRTCYTGAGCATPCSGIPEPISFIRQQEAPTTFKSMVLSVPSILLFVLVLGFAFAHFIRKRKN